MKKTTLLIMSLFLVKALASASDWPMGRKNPARTGASPDVARPPLTLRWSSNAIGERFVSSPVVADGVVAVGGEDNKIHAFDALTGQEKWTYTTGGFVDATPSVSDGVLYVGSFDGNVYALDLQTGALEWTAATGGREESSPIVRDKVLYMGSGFPNKSILALSAWNGQVVWQHDTDQFSYASPAFSNGLVVGGSNDGNFYFLNYDTGLFRFSPYATEARIYFVSPAVANSLIYGVSGEYQRTIYAFDFTSGVLHWSQQPFGVDGDAVAMSAPLVTANGVYAAATLNTTSDTELFALDPLTGDPKVGFTPYATGSSDQAKDYGFTSSPIAASDVIYLADADGKLHVVDEATGAAFPATPITVGSGDPILSSVATANGWVYAASFDGKLYAYQADEIVAISSPSDTDKVSSTSTVTVMGFLKPATSETFQSYTLEYGVSSAPASWTPIATQTTATTDGTEIPLGIWDISSLSDGVYTLRLTVVFSNATRVLTHPVRIANTSGDGFLESGAGGTLTLSDGTEVVIPAGAMSQSDSLSVSVPDSYSDEGIPDDVTATAIVREIRFGNASTQLTQSVTIRIPYQTSELGSIPPAQLRLYTWDETSETWKIVNTSSVDTQTRRVSAQINHFSLYRIMGYTPAAGGPLIDSARVYATPNPARGNTVTFKAFLRQDADVTVQVFNVAGEKITEQHASGLGGLVVQIPWDVSSVASGAYIFRLEARGGGAETVVTKKLAIIH